MRSEQQTESSRDDSTLAFAVLPSRHLRAVLRSLHAMPTTPFRLLWLLPTLVSLGLLAVPGWPSLDYHACLILTPVAFVSVGLWACAMPPALLATSVLALAGLLPCAVLAAGDLWQVRCDRVTGLGFALLGPVLAPWLALGTARFAQLLGPRWPRLWFVLLTLGLCAPGVWQFVWHPQVFGYATPVGFVAGAIYEDGVDLHRGYTAFRALDAALWLPAALLPQLVRPWTLSGLWSFVRGKGQRASVVRAVLGSCLLAVAVGVLQAPVEGWRVSTRQVERALPIAVELDDVSPPVVLHMPAGIRWRKARRHAVLDTRWRLAQLREWFGTAPTDSIGVYLYPGPATKQRLMGARNVEIAKPWLHQVHLVLPEAGASVLLHELAHVFAGVWSQGWLGVPARVGLVPDALLIEGLAVAAEWPRRGGLSPHQWSAAMLGHKLAPPLSQLAAPTGFFAASSDTAYTLAGSFLRWLAETHGKAAVQSLYARADWTKLPGGSLATLEAQWLDFLTTTVAPTLTDTDRERALARFDRPGLFARPCLLATGRCAAEAHRLWQIGRPADAYARWKQLTDTLAGQLGTPLTPDLQLTRIEAQFVAGEHAQSLAALQGLLDATGSHKLTRLQRAAALILRGDLYLQQGKLTQAEADWAAAALQPISDDALRTLAVKTHLARHPAGLPVAQALLAEGHEGAAAGRLLASLAEQPKLAGDRAAAWLWGRWRLRQVDWPPGGLGQLASHAAARRAVLFASAGDAALDCAPVVPAATAARLLRRAAATTLLMDATSSAELDRVIDHYPDVWHGADATLPAEARARLAASAL